jgi:hypothetical protein
LAFGFLKLTEIFVHLSQIKQDYKIQKISNVEIKGKFCFIAAAPSGIEWNWWASGPVEIVKISGTWHEAAVDHCWQSQF